MSHEFQIQTLGERAIASPLCVQHFVDDHAGILLDATTGKDDHSDTALEAAGPRTKIFFDAAATRAAIVTCGGLCPGLNDVIRALTMVLQHRYGVQSILGLRYGYSGLADMDGCPPIQLTPDLVEDIHQHGGTILGSSRGHQDIGEMVDSLVEHDIDILFTIGGDGTQRGAQCIAAEITERGAPISVVGVPKTIDNDVLYTERTFGFETAVAMSRGPITCAHMEAKGICNGIGLVKLMGRDSGFVAASASLASSDVNLVLVPEVPFSLPGLYDYLEKRLEEKAHAVIVAAEGVGRDLVPCVGTDASGNRKYADVGLFLKAEIGKHFGSRAGVKYIDPSYTIRSAPASADDSVFCFRLAENAVHAAMAGKTGMVVGLWNGHFVHVPMEQATARRNKIDPAGALWQSVLMNTGQPAELV